MKRFVEGRDRATARRHADQESGAWKEGLLLHRMSPEMALRRCAARSRQNGSYRRCYGPNVALDSGSPRRSRGRQAMASGSQHSTISAISHRIAFSLSVSVPSSSATYRMGVAVDRFAHWRGPHGPCAGLLSPTRRCWSCPLGRFLDGGVNLAKACITVRQAVISALRSSAPFAQGLRIFEAFTFDHPRAIYSGTFHERHEPSE